jgi:hypothetical protein
MVGESFHPSGCWGEDSNHIRLGATVQKLLRLFAIDSTLNIALQMFGERRRSRKAQEITRTTEFCRGSFLVFPKRARTYEHEECGLTEKS